MKKNILEEKLKKNAIYSIDDSDWKEVDIKEIIEPIQWEVLGEGAHSVVYKIIDQNWVVKEGKWIYDFPLSKRIKIPIHTGFAQRLVDNTFLPTKKEIQRQYRLYQTLARYLGYFDEKSEVYHPDLENIFNEQYALRNTLRIYKSEIEKYYAERFSNKLIKLLESDVKYHNFLPKEYLLYSEGLSKKTKGKKTFFLFQEFIKGETLHDVKLKKLKKSQKRELMLFCYLILLMGYKDNFIPDTRPQSYILEFFDWLTSTDNIIVTKKGLKFIDTRLGWYLQVSFRKRGLGTADKIINHAIINLKKLLDEY